MHQNLYTTDRYVQRSRSRTRAASRSRARDSSLPSYGQYAPTSTTYASLSRSSSVTPGSRQGSFANFYEYAAQKNQMSRQNSRTNLSNYQYPLSKTK